MTIATFSPVDYGVILLYLAAMLALGFYFAARQTDAAEFFLGSRSLGWFPLGLSLMVMLVSVVGLTGLTGEAYEQGLKCWIVPASIWLIMPIVLFLAVPIYRGLSLYSLFEYLEYRFDARVRLIATLIFVVWRLLWLGLVIYAPCKAITISAGSNLPDWVLIVPLGLITTAYTFLGGMRAVVWTSVIQGFMMLLGVVVIVVGIWLSLDGGPARVMEVARGLDRTRVAETHFSWTDQWTIWAVLPNWLLASLSFYVADQVTAQRFLCAANVNTARTSYFVSTLASTFLLAGLIYVGLCLLAFYHDHPRDLRPEWVVNLNGQTRQPVLDESGRPLLDPKNPADAIVAENIDRLLAERRILRPNDKLPFTSADEIIDPETDRVMIEKLAMQRPGQGRGGGEVILRRGINDELIPQFIATHLRWGAAGIVLTALLAGSMAFVASGLNAICNVMVMDLHRRFGWGKGWLAHRLGKRSDELSEVDELKLAQPLTLAIGIVATLFSIFLVQIADVFSTMVGVANMFGAPLLAVFLLGMLTRRTTAAAALEATICGGLFTLSLTAIDKLSAYGFVSKDYAIAEIWNVVFGFAFTFLLGYLLSFVTGRRKTNTGLRGLVVGCGTLGVRSRDEAIPIISVPGE